MADKCIGKLTLDISDVEKKVNAINQALAGIGKNASIKIKIAEEVKAQIDKIYQELENGSKKIIETANKAVESINKIGEAKFDSSKQEASVQKTLALYEKLYNARNRLYELEQKGQQNTVAYAKATADVEKYEMALSKISETTHKAAQSRKEYQAILDKSIAVQNAAKVTEEAKEIEKATQAYIKLLDAKSKVKQLETEGKQDTQEYLKATQAAGKAYDAFIQYSKGAREAAKASHEAAQARKDLNAIEEKVTQDTSKIDYLAQIKQQYFEITDAVKNYNAAKKAGDSAGMADAQARIDASMQEVAAIQEAVKNSNLEESVKQQILNITQQCVTAEHQHSAEINSGVKASSDLSSQVNGILMRYLSLMAVIRTITGLIRNMVDYVSEYSDKMNEIQMITLKTDSEIESLAKTYRNLAADMNVSSLDMADAAIYFTRQGLGAAEIEKRLKNVTMYAKAANVEFKDASEIITAVVNSMGLVEQEAEDGRNATQRVADVFLKIGDNAATSGQEIGEAMQKAAASAGAFGVSMEWLASYIATVSETTRQEARTIGTAFNTIIARLHQIKQTGYNSDDETKVNDIAKALSKIDVVLMDQQGNWRDMEDILVDIADKWGELDGKTKSYIATTMAGVKQQNVFLALMNDMSKGVENGSRAFELYNLAVDSAGTAAEKYGVYLDSVEAAQNRLTVAQEKFYSLLSQDLIKGWYNGLADLVNMITEGAEAWNSWNIIIPIVAAVAAGLIVVIHGINAGLIETITLTTLLEEHPIMMAISAAILAGAGLVAILSSIAQATETAAEKFDRANKTLSESSQRLTQYTSLQKSTASMFESFGEKIYLTSEDLKGYNGLLEQLALISPTASRVVNELREGFIDQQTAAKLLNEELEKVIENEKAISLSAIRQKLYNWNGNIGGDNAAVRASNFGQDYLKDTEEFEKRLRSIWSTAMVLPKYGQQGELERYLSRETINTIKTMMNDLKTQHYSEDDMWKQIATQVWGLMAPDGKSIADQMNSEINQMIDEVVATFTARNNLTTSQAHGLRNKIIKEIFGDDMELDTLEYRNAAKNLNNIISQILIDGIEEYESPVSFMMSKGQNIFGKAFNTMFEDFKENNDAEKIAEEFGNVYEEMLKSGLSELDIDRILGSMELSEWGNALAIYRKRLKDKFISEFGEDFLTYEEYDADMDDTYLESYLDQLDTSTMTLIDDLVSAGASYEKIQEIFQNSLSMDDFIQNLKKFQKEMDNTTYSLDALVKQINASVKEIQSIDAAIKDIEENKDNINYGNILGLAEAHPELLTVINDTEKLVAVLKEIREETSKSQRASIKEMILNETGAMAKSEYASSGYATLAQYRQSLVDAESTAELEAFDAAIDGMIDGWQKANENAKETAKETKEETKAVEKTFNDAIKEVETLDKILKNIRDKKAIDFSDIINLSAAHPEILGMINDLDALQQALMRLRSTESELAITKIQNSILGTDLTNTPFADKVTDTVKTLDDYRKTLEEGSPEFEAVSAYLEQCAMNLFSATGYLDHINADKVKEWQNMFFGGGNVNLNNRPTVNASKLTSAGWSNAGEGIATLFSSTYSAGGEGADLHWNQNVVFDVTPITADGKVLTPQELDDYVYELFAKSTSLEDLLANDKADKGLLIHIRTLLDSESFDAAMASESKQMEILHLLQQALYGVNEAEKSWLQTQAELAAQTEEVNWAKSNNFAEQINALQQAVETGGIKEAINIFNGWSDKMKEAIASEYPELIKAMGDADKAIQEQGDSTADLTRQTKELNTAMSRIERLNNVKYFTETAKAVKQLSQGTISATAAYETYDKELNKVTKAYEDILDVQSKMDYNARDVNKDNQQAIDAADVNNLASLLNMTTDEILADFPAAVSMFNELTSGAGELTSVLNELNAAAFIRITGQSEADFSQLENGLHAIQADAQATIDMLVATGQWEVETANLPQEGLMWDPVNGTWTRFTNSAQATFLKPSGNNPFKGNSTVKQKADTKSNSRKGGGGGGGNKNNKSGMTEVERMLDIMSQVNTIQSGQYNYYQSQQKYYQQTGQLQGVIAYMQREKDLLDAQNKTLDDNIVRIEKYMAEKKAELAQLSITDEEYEEVADDLDKLQKAHQSYTKQLVDNKTSVESLTQAIKEQRDKIRSMEIDLRNTIRKAIEDREKRTEDMLKREIEMENTILDLITKRYEKERDEIIDSTKRRIDLLNDEKTLLSEQLQMRKDQADQEDKLVKLKELEVKYQRIVADPTRQKEALSIRKEIEELRKEMAWDAAEKEVEAQQEALDQQINSLEDYITYVQEYYEDLFEHPTKLIEEMKSILTQTDEEIIAWLKKNDESYAKSTENTQNEMVKSWQKTLDDMHGIIKTYWDEVEQIIAQGDDYIIEFLKENSADYREAGKLQAEAYVDEWQKKLDDLKKAHEKVVADIAASYQTIEKADTSSSSKSSGGGGGGGKKNTQTTEDHGYSFVYGGKTYASNGFASKESANIAMQKAVNDILRVGAGTMASSSMIGQGIRLSPSRWTVRRRILSVS